MQAALMAFDLTAIGAFLAAHWILLSLCLLAVAVLVVLDTRQVRKHWPQDTLGNGIVIGKPKAFDNRSLTLRLERLNAGLEQVKVINQNVTDSLGSFQEQTSSTFNAAFSARAKDPAGKPAPPDKAEVATEPKKDPKAAPAASDPPPEFKPALGLGAADLLTNQLNLANQIFNLQILNERSLSDRIIDNGSRLQTVLGFQVSINPPAGYEDCAAITEVAVRVKAPPRPSPAPPPVSLVALMPQEKTYNAESISSSEASIDGSAVANILTLGISGKRGARQLFIHRDSDTVAFERDPGASPEMLWDATVFGWEFRPVLGRRTVSPGIRQLLAVVAVPEEDKDPAAESTLEVRTRTYWRRYARSRQTTAPNWSWLPWRVDRSATVTSDIMEVQVPNTARVQSTLAPKIDDIKWVNIGDGKTTVIVTGSNFFSGTKVHIGGVEKREESGNLTLKSDQALEFTTTLGDLTTGDAVLSGRFGPSFQLVVPESKRAVSALGIASATFRPFRNSKALRISVNLVGQDAAGIPKELTVAGLMKLPEPILFVGTEAVPMPYDYSDIASGDSNSVSARYVRVEAWISAKTLTKSPTVSFRVPFCGLDFQASQPLAFSEPTAVRMGQDGINTVFRIFFPKGLAQATDFNVDLDKTYQVGSAELVSIDSSDSTSPEYRFTVPTVLVSRFQNMVLRIGKAEPYLLPILPEDKPAPKAAVDLSVAPAKIAKSKHGPVEWTGTALDTITAVNITPGPPPAPGQPPVTPIPQQFSTYANGTRLLVFLSPGVTDNLGKITIECSTASSDDKLSLALYVVES